MRAIKKTFFPLLMLVSLMVFLVSCKKDADKSPMPADTFPSPISNIVSQSMIDSLRSRGTIIHDGATPPVVNGIYFMHPDSCIYDNSPSDLKGTLFVDYKFNFANQDNSLFTVSVGQKEMVNGNLSPSPAYSYISGSGNDFSIFIVRTTAGGGIPVQQFNILSGTLTASGIQHFQNTLYMRSKAGDPSNTVVVPAGTVRVFVTGAPGLATIASTF